MLVFAGPDGGVSWGITQTMVRHNWSFLLKRMTSDGENTPNGTFGSPFSWETFKCGGRCGGRVLPIDIADVDHILPKFYMPFSIVEQNDMLTIPCFSTPDKGNKWIIASYGAITVASTSTADVKNRKYHIKRRVNKMVVELDTRTVEWDINNVLINNVDNLQLLCPPCNRSKGAS
ncbi:HNH endonuclease signature motif containing protein [uncultured Enterobacter sp.]|uniref:HNH endonuclease signature motif containing protein n=1 Tax=uncultured Enterobacter sp. TaxID=238202 RepID=UPI002618EF03|nr:HNH endonuclease signature motif containing protein [uncultured Enterobacter sp.]